MGLDIADLNGDGLLDYCITDDGPPLCLLTQADGGFVDGTASLGIATDVPAGTVGWGIEVLDFDADGHLDLAQASGPSRKSFAEDENPPQLVDLLWRGAPGGFREVGASVGFASSANHIGLAAADLDGDGGLDLVVGGPGTVPGIHMNVGVPGNRLEVDLIGPPGNRDGFGAVVTVKLGDEKLVQALHGPRGPSQRSVRLGFGLGDTISVDTVVVDWPDGSVTSVSDVSASGRITVSHPGRGRR